MRSLLLGTIQSAQIHSASRSAIQAEQPIFTPSSPIHAAQSKNPGNLAISGVFNFFANAAYLISRRCVFIANQNSLG
ncbi:hypothetical protein [Achromobacter insuavis]|uniref:hypothetical protein n=1 Tax=Achromobacter insuavis TaxID=1287735 RepID=UPI0012F4B385|nr:hypothetical protein [Achromobacter insuavis]